FDEGGPGARHADDEDRRIVRMSGPRVLQEPFGADRLDRGENRAVRLEVVADGGPLAPLACLELRERGVVVAEGLELRREGMPQVQLPVDVVDGLREQCAQRSYPARIGPGSPQLREHAVGLEEAAVDANGALERGLGTGEVAENPQRRAEVVLEIRPPRRERRRTPERARRLPMRTAPGEHDADGVE